MKSYFRRHRGHRDTHPQPPQGYPAASPTQPTPAPTMQSQQPQYQYGQYAAPNAGAGTAPPPVPQGYPAATPHGNYSPSPAPSAPPADLPPPPSTPQYVANATTSSMPSSAAPSGANSGFEVAMSEAGAFADLKTKVEPIPAASVTAANAATRLLNLKRKFNELQKKRASYHARQAANGGVAAASALFTAGTSLLLQGPAAIHQRNRLQQIVKAMRECIAQINTLRTKFREAVPDWDAQEALVPLDEAAFSKAIKRAEVHGPL